MAGAKTLGNTKPWSVAIRELLEKQDQVEGHFQQGLELCKAAPLIEVALMFTENQEQVQSAQGC